MIIIFRSTTTLFSFRNMKSVAVFLKIIVSFVLTRPFGAMIIIIRINK